MRRSIVIVALTLAAALLMAAGRLVWAAGAYYDRGQAVEAGDPHQACLWYGETMRAYLPLYHPRFGMAHEALRRMAEEAEAGGDLRLALFAWEEIHASLRAVRWLRQPSSEWLAESEEQIQRLLTLLSEEKGPEAALPPPSAVPPAP
jgi:hypothetical protein